MHGLFVMLPVAIVIAIGNVLARLSVVTPEGFAQINRAIFWTAIPALIFRMTSGADLSTLSDGSMGLVVYLTFVLAPPLAWFLSRWSGSSGRRVATSALMLIRSNTVFIGLPVVTLAIGQPGVDVLSMYVAVTFVGYQIISLWWGTLALSGGLSWSIVQSSLKRLAVNPLVVSSVMGFALALLGWNVFPAWVDETLKLLGNVASGMALLSLGGSLQVSGIPGMVVRSWRDVALKLLFLPAFTWGLFLLCPVPPVVLRTVVLIAAMPVAVDCFILSRVLGMDGDYAADTIMASTILSALTVPFWILLLDALA